MAGPRLALTCAPVQRTVVLSIICARQGNKMPKPKQPRHGSMQFWPRKRASRPYARLRSFAKVPGLLAFAGYKMGMTQVRAIDTNKNSPTKGEVLALPCTVVECPAMRIYSIRGYARNIHGMQPVREAVVAKDKHLARKVSPSTSSLESFSIDGLIEVRVILMTQPSKTGIGQKRPQLFEVGLGAKTPAEQFELAKTLAGKEIKASELFKEGEYIDVHAVTTGRGYQGPVKRFGIGLKSHKSEKGRRRPGSLGGWSGQQHVMYRVAMAGQTGYHQRVQYNNQVLKITENPDDVNVAGGYLRYGTGKKGNEFVVVQGSIPGPKKRLITLAKPIRLKPRFTRPLPTVEAVSVDSPQGK